MGNVRLTQKAFEDKCEEIFGDKYEYLHDIYRGMYEDYKFYCKDHGFFITKPVRLIHQGQGCKKCGIQKVKNKIKGNLISQLEDAHQDKYVILDWFDFSGRGDKVKAECKDHGEYTSSVASIIDTDYGGCPKCKQLKEGVVFIQKAKKVHGDKYSYDKEDYRCSRTLMKIWCNTHNKYFKQRPSAHLQGQNCPDCGRESFHTNMTTSQEDFIEGVNERHKGFYNYSKVIYKDTRKKIVVICPKHGEFEISPQNHRHGGGCPVCSKEKIREEYKKVFISNSKTMYGETTYDYSEVDYINNRTNIKLKCNIHNEWFLTTPNKHLMKSSSGGCPVCGKLAMNRWSFKAVKQIRNIDKEVGYFYVGIISSLKGTKIGVTKNLIQREEIYRRDLDKYPDISFNYIDYVETSYLTAFLIESVFKSILKPYFHKHDLVFGGKNEVYEIPCEVEELLSQVIAGRYSLELDYLASVIDDTKDEQFKNFVNKLKDSMNE